MKKQEQLAINEKVLEMLYRTENEVKKRNRNRMA